MHRSLWPGTGSPSLYSAWITPTTEDALSPHTDLFAACHASAEAPGQILVVDDDPDNREILARECADHPFQLHFATTGTEGLALSAERKFEGILLDVNLPDMTGIEVCQRLARQPKNAQTPRIFLSARAKTVEWLLIGLEAGAIDYLTWPYAPPELLAKLRVMVRLARQHELLSSLERARTLLEVTGGTAHELSQPLATAQLLLDRWIASKAQPGPEDLLRLQAVLDRAADVLQQLRGLNDYTSTSYPGGSVLDLKASVKARPS